MGDDAEPAVKINKKQTNTTTTFPFRKLLLDITTHSVLLLQSLQFQCCVVVCAAVLLTVSICLPLSVGYLTWHVVRLCTKLNRGCAFSFFFFFFEIFKDDQSADVLSHVGLLLWFYIG